MFSQYLNVLQKNPLSTFQISSTWQSETLGIPFRKPYPYRDTTKTVAFEHTLICSFFIFATYGRLSSALCLLVFFFAVGSYNYFNIVAWKASAARVV